MRRDIRFDKPVRRAGLEAEGDDHGVGGQDVFAAGDGFGTAAASGVGFA